MCVCVCGHPHVRATAPVERSSLAFYHMDPRIELRSQALQQMALSSHLTWPVLCCYELSLLKLY